MTEWGAPVSLVTPVGNHTLHPMAPDTHTHTLTSQWYVEKCGVGGGVGGWCEGRKPEKGKSERRRKTITRKTKNMDRLRLCRHLSFRIYVSVNLMSLIYSKNKQHITTWMAAEGSADHVQCSSRTSAAAPPASEQRSHSSPRKDACGDNSLLCQTPAFYLLHAPKHWKRFQNVKINEPMTILPANKRTH